MTGRALLVVDCQVDFCEGGALGVAGGGRVANAIYDYIMAVPDAYELVIATMDAHMAPPHTNCGHFALDGEPDFVTSWPVHCVADSVGADLHPALESIHFDHVVRKGYGTQSYSGFEGVAWTGQSLLSILRSANVGDIDVCGIATDYCVKATVMDALGTGFNVRVLTDMCAGVTAETSADALLEMKDAGATLF